MRNGVLEQIGKNLKKGSNIDGKENYPVVHVSYEMQLHIVIGQEKDYQLKLNGNMQDEEVKIKYILGEFINRFINT